MKKCRKVKNYYYDFETRNWSECLCAVVMDDEGNRWTFIGPSAAQKVYAMQERVGGRWTAHAGGIFDHLLCWRDGLLPREVVMASSSVLKATAAPSHSRKELSYADSYPRSQSGLDKWAKSVGMKKIEVDRANVGKLSTTELLTYCARDTEILRAGSTALDAWLASFDVQAITSGSQAVKLLQVFDPETWGTLEDNLCDPQISIGVTPVNFRTRDVDESIRRDYCNGALDAVRGGRVEVRRIGHVVGPIYCYDLHSSYPSQYSKGRIPVGLEFDPSTNIDDWGWVDMVSWQQPDDGKTAFELSQDNRGKGNLSAWMPWEIAWELAKRNMKPVRHGVGWKGTGSINNFGKKFVNDLFAIKEAGDMAASMAAKVTVNSLHGKLGENPMRWKYLLRDDEMTEEEVRLESIRSNWLRRYMPWSERVRIQPHQQPLAAATVLGRARLTLAITIETLEKHGWEFYYCDTDCVHTNCPPEKFQEILSFGSALGQWGLGFGSALGQWGLEHVAPWAIYLAPKSYYLAPNLLGGSDKLRSKGMPLDKLDAQVFAEAAFQQAKGVEITRTGLKKFRQGTEMGQMSELKRTLKPVFHGRTLQDDGRLVYL